MRSRRTFWTVAAGIAGIVIGATSSSTVNTQDRGTPVIVANTAAEPVPTEVVNRGPLNANVTNDPARPLFVAPGDGGAFDVCPTSCGAYQVDASHGGQTNAAILEFDVPPGMRFTIRYLAAHVKVPVDNSVRLAMTAVRLQPDGSTTYNSLFLPVQAQGIFNNHRILQGSFPVHFYHDSIEGEHRLRVAASRNSATSGTFEIYVMASGNLEPMPAQ